MKYSLDKVITHFKINKIIFLTINDIQIIKCITQNIK